MRAMVGTPTKCVALLRASWWYAGAATCWAQLAPFELELAPDKIETYLREVGAGPELRATWAAMRARGLPWKERYTKHARVELAGGQPEPSPLPVEALLRTPGVPRAGELLSFEVLRQGRPLAHARPQQGLQDRCAPDHLDADGVLGPADRVTEGAGALEAVGS